MRGRSTRVTPEEDPEMNALVLVMGTLLCVLIGAWFLFSLVVVSQAIYYHGVVRRSLEEELGFCHGSVSFPSSGLLGYTKAVAVVSVVTGGTFEKAGFRSGDILPEVSFVGLFKLLHRRRGKLAKLTVVDCGTDLPLELRPRREICFVVPQRNKRE
jgi:hypothetical protein